MNDTSAGNCGPSGDWSWLGQTNVVGTAESNHCSVGERTLVNLNSGSSTGIVGLTGLSETPSVDELMRLNKNELIKIICKLQSAQPVESSNTVLYGDGQHVRHEQTVIGYPTVPYIAQMDHYPSVPGTHSLAPANYPVHLQQPTVAERPVIVAVGPANGPPSVTDFGLSQSPLPIAAVSLSTAEPFPSAQSINLNSEPIAVRRKPRRPSGRVRRKKKAEKDSSSDATTANMEHRAVSQIAPKKDTVMCEHCGKAMRPVSLKQHVRTVHSETEHRCSDCDYTTTNPRSLSTHKKHKHQGFQYPKAIVLQCEYCGKLIRRHRLDSHIKSVHQGQTITGGKCSYCDIMFKYKENIVRHERSFHADQIGNCRSIREECSYCKKCFRKDLLTAHVQHVHLGLKRRARPPQTKLADYMRRPVTCDICKKTLRFGSMSWHRRFVHNLIASSSSQLKQKHRVRTKKERFFCEVCGLSLTKRALERHYSSSHLGCDQKCPACNVVVIGDRAALGQHILLEHLSNGAPSTTVVVRCANCNAEVRQICLQLHGQFFCDGAAKTATDSDHRLATSESSSADSRQDSASSKAPRSSCRLSSSRATSRIQQMLKVEQSDLF